MHHRSLWCVSFLFRLSLVEQRAVFTVRVIHSLPLLMSAVQIYYRDKMIAVSHLVGTDTIPVFDPKWVSLYSVLSRLFVHLKMFGVMLAFRNLKLEDPLLLCLPTVVSYCR